MEGFGTGEPQIAPLARARPTPPRAGVPCATDCYLTLNRLAHENAETIIPAALEAEEDSLATRPRAQEGGATGLFDAQSRRHREVPGGRRGLVD